MPIFEEYNGYMVACVWFSNETLITVNHDPNTDKIKYVYSKPFPKINETRRKTFTRVLDDSVILSPFIKHTYPSYPYTNKKMKKNIL